MTPSRMPIARRAVRLASGIIAVAVLLSAVPACTLHAQNPDHPLPPEPGQVRTFFLKNVTDVHDLNDIQTALRNMVSRAKIYADATDNAITIRGTVEDLDMAQKLIAELDRPKQVYRVTYTIDVMDSGKRVSSRTVSVVVPENGKGTLKQGKRVPLATGTSGTGSDQTTQFQYIDIGMNLEANATGPQLRTKIEETAVTEDKSIAGVQEPVIQQTMFEGSSPLVTTKPVVLGTVDVPGSTHQERISVKADVVSGAAE